MQIIDATTPEQFQQLLAEHPRVLVDFHKRPVPGLPDAGNVVAPGGQQHSGAGHDPAARTAGSAGRGVFRELGLRQTPTLSLFRDGDERTRLAGFQSPQQIEAAIALHL